MPADLPPFDAVDLVDVGHDRLEVGRVGEMGSGETTLVFLHEGLGSARLWRSFPRSLAERLGLPAVAYSRAGFGASSPEVEPRPWDWMQRDAEEQLPTLLETLGIGPHVLYGHSDGATIALLYGATFPERPRALVCEAPHVFLEDLTLAGVRNAAVAFESGLRRALVRHHKDPDAMFRAWHDTWLSEDFGTKFDLAPQLPNVVAPTLLLQGRDDTYGSAEQLERIERLASGPVEAHLLPDCQHSPHDEQPEAVLDLAAAFLRERLALEPSISRTLRDKV